MSAFPSIISCMHLHPKQMANRRLQSLVEAKKRGWARMARTLGSHGSLARTLASLQKTTLVVSLLNWPQGSNSTEKVQVYFKSRTMFLEFQFNIILDKFPLQASNLTSPNFTCALYNCKKKKYTQYLYWIDPRKKRFSLFKQKNQQHIFPCHAGCLEWAERRVIYNFFSSVFSQLTFEVAIAILIFFVVMDGGGGGIAVAI